MNRLPILTYHSLDKTESVVSISPSLFERQMQWLYRNGWHALSLDEILAGRMRGEWQPRTFALTFDDGFRNFIEYALPTLTRLHFTAIVFVVSNWVGKTNDWASQFTWVPRQPLMNWDELWLLTKAGVKIGAHSVSHPRFAHLSVAEALDEIVNCKRAIEQQIGCPIESFAYPYGEMSRIVEETVDENYRAGFGTQLGFATAQSRITAFERIDTYYLRQPKFFHALASDWLEKYLRMRRWLRQARRGSRLDFHAQA